MSIAERVFRTQQESLAAEATLGDAIDEIAPNAWEHFTTDYYDRSVEVYFGADPVDADRVANALFAHGFKIVWIHPHTPPRSNCKCLARVPS